MKGEFTMKKLLLAFLGCVCILSGCQEAPDQVKKNMNGYGESKQIDLEGVDYCSPQELKNVDIEDITYKPDNLELPSKIDFSDVEDVGVVYFKAKEKFTDNRDEFADFIGKGDVDWERSETAGGGWNFYDKDSEGWIQDNGTFGFWLGRYNQYVRSDNYLKITNRVYLGREDCPDLVCNLDGTSVSLKDVIAGTDRWVNEFKYLKGDLTYKAKTVYVRTDDQGNDYVGLFYQPMYKGVGLSYLTYPMDNNISGGGVVIVAMTSGVDLDVEKPDTVSDCVTQLNVDVESEDMADKVIDFNSALKLVEEKMSGFNRLNVVEVRIEYVLRPLYDPEKESVEDEGIIMEARPVYSFLIPNGYQEDDFSYSFSDEENGLVYINVDMIDGTVTDDFAANSFHGN